jgi:hypothetical protein
MDQDAGSPAIDRMQAKTEREREIVGLYLRWHSMEKIGRRMGRISRQRVQQILKRNGVYGRKIAAETRARVAQIAEGRTREEIESILCFPVPYRWIRNSYARNCELCEERFSPVSPNRVKRQILCPKCHREHGAHWTFVQTAVKFHHPIFLQALNRLAQGWK